MTQFTTAVEQSFIIVAKEQHVVMQEVFYGDSIADQVAPEVVAPVVKGEGYDVTRLNALHTVVQIMKAIPFEYDRFMNVYVPGLVLDQLSNSVRWMQHFKQAIAREAEQAENEGRDSREIGQLTFPYTISNKRYERVVTAQEVDLWAELHKQKGDKPFINLHDTSDATKGFRDERSGINDAMLSRAYDKLREIGADIKEQKKPGADTKSKRVRVSLGGGSVESDHGSAS